MIGLSKITSPRHAASTLVLVVLAGGACGRSEELIVGRLITTNSSGGSSAGVGGAAAGGVGGAAQGGSDAGIPDAGAAGTSGAGVGTDAGAVGGSAGMAGSSGQPCGTGTGPCPADEFCSFAGVEACAQGANGRCVQRPTVCPTQCATPMLCACNGQRYCNECLAQAAGFDLGPDGVCMLRHCGSWLGIGCSDSEFCDYPDLACGGERVGNCLVRPDPTNCPVACDTTCACDGLEYCTECDAHVAGFDRAEGCQ